MGFYVDFSLPSDRHMSQAAMAGNRANLANDAPINTKQADAIRQRSNDFWLGVLLKSIAVNPTALANRQVKMAVAINMFRVNGGKSPIFGCIVNWCAAPIKPSTAQSKNNTKIHVVFVKDTASNSISNFTKDNLHFVERFVQRLVRWNKLKGCI